MNIIEVHDLTKTYGDLTAVDHIRFTVEQGTMLGFLGINGAWGGLGTIIGTLVGFLGGIYFPIGQLSDGIAAIMKCTPVIYGTALFRSEMTAIVLADTFQGIPAEVVTEFSRIMGIELMIGDHALTAPQELLILLTCGIVFLIWGAAAVRFSKKADR